MVCVMEHLSLAGEVIIGAGIGLVLSRVKRLEKRMDNVCHHIAECPAAKRHKTPLEQLWAVLAVAYCVIIAGRLLA